MQDETPIIAAPIAPRKGSRGRPRKDKTHKHVAFREPLAQYDLLARTAAALGTDVAPLLNVILTNSVPFLAERLEQHEADVAALKATLERKESA